MLIIGNSHVSVFDHGVSSPQEPVRVLWVGALKASHFASGHASAEAVLREMAGEPGWTYLFVGNHDFIRLHEDASRRGVEVAFAALAAEWSSMWTRLAAAGRVVWVRTVPQPPENRPETLPEVVALEEEFARLLAPSLEAMGIPVLDAVGAHRDARGLVDPLLLQSDGLHLHPRHAAIVATVLQEHSGIVLETRDDPGGRTFDVATEEGSVAQLVCGRLDLPRTRLPSRGDLVAAILTRARALFAEAGLEREVVADTNLWGKRGLDSFQMVRLWEETHAEFRIPRGFDVDLRTCSTAQAIAERILAEREGWPGRDDFVSTLDDSDPDREEAFRRLREGGGALARRLREVVAQALGEVHSYGLLDAWIAACEGDPREALVRAAEARRPGRRLPRALPGRLEGVLQRAALEAATTAEPVERNGLLAASLGFLREAAEAGRDADVAPLLEGWLALLPGSLDLLLAQARLDLACGRREQGESGIERAAAIWSWSPEIPLLRARALLQAGEPARAFEQVKEAYGRDSACLGLPATLAALEVVLAAPPSSTDRPRVTAIVATWSSERFIRGCLDDLLAQTLWARGQLEIVVVDTASPEGESAIVREYQARHGSDRIRLVRTEDRRGMYAAWNLGVSAARGTYLTNANADDRHRPDALEVLASALDSDPSVHLVYSDCAVSTEANATWQEAPKDRVYRYPEYRPADALLHFQFGIHPMWRRSVHEKIGMFDDSFRAAGDWDFNLRFALAGLVARKVDQALGLYYLATTTVSFSSGAMVDENRRIKESYRTIENLRLLLENEAGRPIRGQEASEAMHEFAARAGDFRPGWESRATSDQPAVEFAMECARKASEGHQGMPGRPLRFVYHLQFGALRRFGGMAGVESASLAVCRELASLGHQVLLVAQAPTEGWKEGRLEIVADEPSQAERIRLEISRADAFVATSHAASFFRFPIPRTARRIVHFHHAGLQYTMGTEIEKRSIYLEGGCDAVVCVSEFAKRVLRESGVPEEILSVERNGFDVEVFHSSERSRRDPLIILFVGVLQEHKGPEVAIQAVAELRAGGLDCRLRIVGSADLYGASRPWIDEDLVRRTCPWVEFLGVLGKDELAEEYGRAGFVLSPSRIESFGMVSVEAQACGCIPVVANTGGLPETLDPGRTGVIVRENTPIEFANAVRRLLSDPTSLDLMRLAAPSWVRSSCSWRRVAARLAKVAGENLESRSSGPMVSVIVPCYNYGHLLAAAVQSVLDQTFQDLEIIVVNDGSTDDSLEVARRLERENPGVVRVIDQANAGQPAISRNNGIAVARGSIIVPLDADDEFEPGYIDAAVKAIEEGFDIAYPDVLVRREDKDIRIDRAGQFAIERLVHHNQLPYCAAYRRTVWERVGGYRTNVKGYEDWDFWVAAAAAGFRGAPLGIPFLRYLLKDEGLYLSSALSNHARLRRAMVQNHPEAFGPGKVGSGALVHEAEALLQEAKRLFASGEVEQALRQKALADALVPATEIRDLLSKSSSRDLPEKDSAEAILARADILFERQDFQGALEELDEAKVEGRDGLRIVTAKAWLLMNIGRFSAAQVEYLKATQLWPDVPEAHTNLAGFFLQRGLHERAYAPLRKVLEIDPRQPDALLALARLHVRDGRTGEAQDLAHRLQAAAPTHPGLSELVAAIRVVQPEVSIVIPVMDQLPMLTRCLESLESTEGFHAVEIVVVDDRSAEATTRALVEWGKSGRIRLVMAPDAVNLAARCNAGAAIARGRTLVFLDSDIEVRSGWLEPLVQTLDEPGIGVVGARMLFPDGRVQHAGIAFGPDGKPYLPNRGLDGESDLATTRREMPGVTGACLAVRSEFFSSLGGFDPAYSLQVEDLDLCLRVWESGLRVVYEPASCLVHHEGASSKGLPIRSRIDGEGLTRLFNTWADKGGFPPAVQALPGFPTLLKSIQSPADSRAPSAAAFHPGAPTAASMTPKQARIEGDLGAMRMDRVPAPQDVSISIVVPVHGNLELTKKCLDAVRSTTDATTTEIVVVDDASPDNSAEWLREERARGRLEAVILESNKGFAGACNAGAAASSGRTILFLNNDTIVQPGWLEAMLAGLEDPTIGLVGSRLLYPEGDIQHAGIRMMADGNTVHEFRHAAGSDPRVMVSRDRAFVTGACIALRHELFTKIGGFDEGYHMYVEDLDLCLKVWDAGLRVRYVAESVVVHLESRTVPDPARRAGLVKSGLARLMDRWMGCWPEALLGLPDWPSHFRKGASIRWCAPMLLDGPDAEVNRRIVQFLDPLLPSLQVDPGRPEPSFMPTLRRDPDATRLWTRVLSRPYGEAFNVFDSGFADAWEDAGRPSGHAVFARVLEDASDRRSADFLGAATIVLACGREIASACRARGIRGELIELPTLEDGTFPEALLGACARLMEGTSRTAAWIAQRAAPRPVAVAAPSRTLVAPVVAGQGLPSVAWCGPLFNHTGYARQSREAVTALVNLGANVSVDPQQNDLNWFEGLRSDAAAMAHWKRVLSAPAGGDVLVCCDIPSDSKGAHDVFAEMATGHPESRSRVAWTMFETDRAPVGWAEKLNRMDQVWVPSRQVHAAFLASGVDSSRLRIVPDGLDPVAYANARPYALPGPVKGTTFLSVFQWSRRKGYDVLLSAWAQAFRPSDDVRLVLRCHAAGGVSARAQLDSWLSRSGHSLERMAPVILIEDFIPEPEMPGLYAACDVFVLPTRGEGWGLPFLESMAAGKPSIATAWGGQTDFLHEGVAWMLPASGLVPVDAEALRENPFLTSEHRWADPQVADLVSALHAAHGSADERRWKGTRARAEFLARWTSAHTAQAISASLRELPGQDAVVQPRHGTIGGSRLSGVLANLASGLRRDPKGHAASRVAVGAPSRSPSSQNLSQAAGLRSTAPMVSVILPTRDRPVFLRRALESLETQTFRDFEVVVVDDAGCDVSAIAAEFLGRGLSLRLEVHPERRGLGAARNTGIRAARGPWIAYLDDDDLYYPDHLRLILDALDRTGAKVAYSDSMRAVEEERDGQWVVLSNELAMSNDFDRDAFLRTNLTPVNNVIHARTCWDLVGGIDESLPVLEDWDFWIRLSRRWDFVHVPVATTEIRWRSNGANMTFQRQREFQPTRDRIAAKVAQMLRLEGFEREGVSMVILVRDCLEVTKDCLASLELHTPEPHEIILVDNGSNAETAAWLRDWVAARPHSVLVRNDDNRGFAGGNNQGLALAKGRFLLLLNNDTVLTPGWLERMLAVLSRHPECGAVGPVSNRVSGPQLDATATYADASGLILHARDRAQRFQGRSDEILRAVGFCLLFRREVFDAVGGLDERFGKGNFEDDDFSLRVRHAGWTSRMALDSFVHHVGGATFRGENIDYTKSLLTNWAIFLRKWGLPEDLPYERGYPLQESPPTSALSRIETPTPLRDHKLVQARLYLPASTDAATGSIREPSSPTPTMSSTQESATAAEDVLESLSSILFQVESAVAMQDSLQAEALSKEAVELHPDQPLAWLSRAMVLRGAGKSGKALEALTKSASLGGGAEVIYETMALHLQEGRNAPALVQWNLLRTKHPQWVKERKAMHQKQGLPWLPDRFIKAGKSPKKPAGKKR